MDCTTTCRDWCLLLAVGVALGCDAEASLEPSAAEAPAIETSEQTELTVESAQEAADEEVSSEPVAEPGAPSEAATSYKPPYPDRVDLFAAPERKGDGTKNADGSVELIGFAKRDETKALISFNGLVSAVAEGAEQNGVQVISIQPPKVVLQRGRQRWQASIEN